MAPNLDGCFSFHPYVGPTHGQLFRRLYMIYPWFLIFNFFLYYLFAIITSKLFRPCW